MTTQLWRRPVAVSLGTWLGGAGVAALSGVAGILRLVGGASTLAIAGMLL